MKKLFSKIETSGQQNPHIGKVFTVGRYSLTVEDVIAEGRYLDLSSCYIDTFGHGRCTLNL